MQTVLLSLCSAASVLECAGYVGMAFPEKAGKMAPADSVIGYMLTNGAASVKPYHLKVGIDLP